MANLTDTPSRKEALEFISRSASFGNLGAFIGAGFSKAVLNDEFDKIALSWGELLEKASEKLGVDYESIPKDGVSYPEIASIICQEYCNEKNVQYEVALKRLKTKIAALTSWYPNKEKRDIYSKHLTNLSPSWIITTNYDLVIESLLTGKSIPLGPNDLLVATSYVTPVYHLHGLRTNPEEIIIAQEDYVALFRPNEYRQIKLAITIKESTTLFIGYGLGDVNVLTALDWSKNVFSDNHVEYPQDLIQILRIKNPKKKPYRDKNGILIIETGDLNKFFEEIASVHEEISTKENRQIEEIKKLASRLNNPKSSMIDKFIDNKTFRDSILKALAKYPIHLISGFVSFLDRCIDETWKRSEPSGAFEGYNENLILIIDILTAFKVEQIPPALFETTAYALQRVGYYVGEERGKSWSAYKTWNNRKKELSKEMIAELKNFAEQNSYTYIKKLIKSIEPRKTTSKKKKISK